MRWLLALLGVLIWVPAWAEDGVVLPDVAFSATAVHMSGAIEIKERLHYANGRLRIDRGHGFSSVILDLNTQTECILMANRTYLVLPIDTQLIRRFFARDPAIADVHRVGAGTSIDGLHTTKYAFSDEDGLKPAGSYWVASNGILLRRDYDDGLFGQHTHHLETIQDVAVSPQPAELFDVPGGYRRAN